MEVPSRPTPNPFPFAAFLEIVIGNIHRPPPIRQSRLAENTTGFQNFRQIAHVREVEDSSRHRIFSLRHGNRTYYKLRIPCRGEQPRLDDPPRGVVSFSHILETRHPGRSSVPQEVYLFLGEAVCLVYEIGESAFESAGFRAGFFRRGGEFFVADSEIPERAWREAAFALRPPLSHFGDEVVGEGSRI